MNKSTLLDLPISIKNNQLIEKVGEKLSDKKKAIDLQLKVERVLFSKN